MASERELRRKAAFAVARSLASHETRALFASHGHRSGDNVVVALESDTINDVYARMTRQSPPVTVAVYWPETQNLEFTTFEPSPEAAQGESGRPDKIGGSATIGMLFAHVAGQQGSTMRFNLAWGPTANMHVARFPSLA
ncbi:hypothetical protein ACWGDX_13355 [Streptomyces sp. NPDC055025]